MANTKNFNPGDLVLADTGTGAWAFVLSSNLLTFNPVVPTVRTGRLSPIALSRHSKWNFGME